MTAGRITAVPAAARSKATAGGKSPRRSPIVGASMSTPVREERLSRIRTERLAQLGNLLAGFAHEVRNPLSTIGLNLQLVLEEFREPETPRDKRTHKRLSVVEAEVRRLQKILEEFLGFARAPEPRLAPIDLNQRLQALVEFHEPEFAGQGLSLRFYPVAGLEPVLADWDHLQAAFVNLLRNAKDATPAGGQVLVSTAREPGFVLLRVTDTGAGIAPELQPRVFDPYFSTKKSGTGLGLPTVRRVAAEHGGSLQLESEVGKGTQFTLRLPLAGAEPQAGGA
jgi:two-component system sensor histidine kinase HydH